MILLVPLQAEAMVLVLVCFFVVGIDIMVGAQFWYWTPGGTASHAGRLHGVLFLSSRDRFCIDYATTGSVLSHCSLSVWAQTKMDMASYRVHRAGYGWILVDAGSITPPPPQFPIALPLWLGLGLHLGSYLGYTSQRFEWMPWKGQIDRDDNFDAVCQRSNQCCGHGVVCS